MDDNDDMQDALDEAANDMMNVPNYTKTGPIESEFLNVFIKYYNTHVQQFGTLLQGIVDEDSTETNEMMEFINSEFEKYNFTMHDEGSYTLYETAEEMGPVNDELYLLKMGDHEFYCRTLVPLIYFISEQPDWVDIVWRIKRLK